MFFIATFDKEWTIAYHAKAIMESFICLSYDHSDLDIHDDIEFESFDDLDNVIGEYDYSRFRRLMQKHNITAKHFVNHDYLNKYHGTGGLIASYTNCRQLKNIYIENIKKFLKESDKDSARYKELMKFYGKIKMVDANPDRLIELRKQCSFMLGEEEIDNKVFYDYEDYIQYVFDNQ